MPVTHTSLHCRHLLSTPSQFACSKAPAASWTRCRPRTATASLQPGTCGSAASPGPDPAGESCWSAGVQVNRYSSSEALAAVSGKSFGCTMCGKCCTLKEDSEVWINTQEVAALAAFLGTSVEHVGATYLQPYTGVPGWRLLKSQQVTTQLPYQLKQQQQLPQQPASKPAVGHLQQQQQQQPAQHQEPHTVCVFLDAAGGCSVYPVRPLQCSTYPWWPELMSARIWHAEQQVMCEGIQHPEAQPLDRWAAAQQLQAATEHVLALEAAKPPGWDAERELYM